MKIMKLTQEVVNVLRSYSNNVMSLISFLDERDLGILNWTDDIGRTILHHIVDNSGSAECVKLLLEKNADPNAVSDVVDKCSTPLHYAARTNNLDCMIVLLEYGAKIDILNTNRQRAIDLATYCCSTDCINYLHKIYALREKEDEDNKAKALYKSIEVNDFEDAKKALDSMKSTYETVNEYSHDGNETLLNSACFHGDKRIVELLIHNQANVRPNSITGETPLYIACYYGHLDVVILLAQTFPELLNLPCTQEQIYPLHAAIIHQKESIVQHLLTYRYKKHGLEKVISNNSTPAESNKYFININQPMGNGYTPIHLAVQSGNKNIISMLLECRPFKKITEKEEYKKYPGCLILDSIVDRKTPLHFALQDVRNLEVIELLLRNGADLNASFIENGLKYTPLQFVCKNENIEVLKLLLKYKAEDHDGISLNEAMENNRDEVVFVLLSKDICREIKENWMVKSCRKDLDDSRTKKDEEDVTSILETINTMVNPFYDDRKELLQLASGQVATENTSRDMLSL